MASISKALFILISFLAGARFLAKDKLLEVFILFQVIAALFELFCKYALGTNAIISA